VGLLFLGLMGLSPAVVADTYGAAASSSTAPGAPIDSIPTDMLSLYISASNGCPGLAWQVLAAVGTVESANGTSNAPGVHFGRNAAGAEGPMQFEPATFIRYALPVPPGGVVPPSPYDRTDAVYAAARMLCADGAARPADLSSALFDYNHSAAYVADVMAVAAGYGFGDASGSSPAETALGYALAQIGTPYRWGGESPVSGFDCSGLVQASWAAAGVALPRVAQAQFDAGPPVPASQGLLPGDLVFFGSSRDGVDHVGIFVGEFGGQAEMVDAPHTGADVRIEPFPDQVGGRWGAEAYLGATRP